MLRKSKIYAMATADLLKDSPPAQGESSLIREAESEPPHKVESKMEDLLRKEEIMWRQRSRNSWLAEGDKNTSYFHRTATGRKKRNFISHITRADGVVVRKEEEIEEVFRSYFVDLFKAGEQIEMTEALEAVDPVVSAEMNNQLKQPFTLEDIATSLTQMHSLKAPGPDGMSALFFKKTWSFVHDDLCASLLKILNEGAYPSCLNDTFICLIPKKKKSDLPKDFRPISLCNVVYKLLSKTIVNSLKHALPSIINETQSAFVPGRLISDNALLAFETFHFFKLNKAKKGSFAFKLDMAKAYDRVEWVFLQSMMEKLGFDRGFVRLILRCVSTVSFSIIMNGSPGTVFQPGRGLRQGDPLSPYLFLFCAEALSALIRRAETNHLLHGARICRRAPTISHLFFADDSIIFGKANERELLHVQHILKVYEKASGQMINLEKSEIAFSAGVEVQKALELAQNIGARRVPKHGIYLGIPCTVGRSKKQVFQMLVDRIRKKLKDWKRRWLSNAGRTVLIKHVAQAIPSYLMSVFLLPENICSQINALTSSFLWGQVEDERRIHWCNWRELCSSKNSGGLGFRELSDFNKAFLAKQAWRLLQNNESTIGKVLRAKYFPRVSFLDAVIAHNPSYTWRSIMAGKKLLQQGIYWRVGNGREIRVWHDKWIPDCPGSVGYLNEDVDTLNMTVSELMDDNEIGWNREKIDRLFPSIMAKKILAIPLPRSRRMDRQIWKYTKNGIYTVRSGYYIARQMREHQHSTSSSSPRDSELWKWINKIKTLPKIRFFLWKCAKGILPVATNLRKKQVLVDTLCRRCGSEEETTEHVFRECNWSSFFWKVSPLRISIDSRRKQISMLDWFEQVARVDDSHVHSTFAAFLWINWKLRNLLVFQNKNLPHQVVIEMANKIVAEGNLVHAACFSHAHNGVLHSWMKPPPEWKKINVDAAVLEDKGIGIGVVIRDEIGKIIVARCIFVRICVGAEVAEALACQEGIRLAREFGGGNVQLETDCRSIELLLQKMKEDLSYLGEIIESIKEEASHFDNVIYSWARRDANKMAHELAKLAISNPFYVAFTGSLPEVVSRDLPSDERCDPY